MNDIGVIHLENGGFTVVDAERLEELQKHTWRLSPFGYVTATIPGKSRHLRIHRLITNAAPGQDVDHINRLKTDNRACNLRFASQSQNSINVAKRKNASSQYKGVCWDKSKGKWVASLKVMYRNRFLGRFDDEAAAAEAYNRAALKEFGKFAVLNTLSREHSADRQNYRRRAFKSASIIGLS